MVSDGQTSGQSPLQRQVRLRAGYDAVFSVGYDLLSDSLRVCNVCYRREWWRTIARTDVGARWAPRLWPAWGRDVRNTFELALPGLRKISRHRVFRSCALRYREAREGTDCFDLARGPCWR